MTIPVDHHYQRGAYQGLDTAGRATDWRDQARCAGMDGLNGRPDFLTTSPAEMKRVCHGCPVRLDCLAFALHTEQSVAGMMAVDGNHTVVYGGLDGRERATLHKRYRRDLDLALVEVALLDVASVEGARR